MKKVVTIFLFLLFGILSACAAVPQPSEEVISPPPETTAEFIASVPTTIPVITEPETTAAPPQPVVILSEEEETMLLKIAMAERGNSNCTECIALVMRTVLNRLEAGRFGSSIRSVLFAQDQFTPVMDGTYHSAEPNDRCQEALDMIVYGWDESQGALYYEWCTGESWHSKNLHLLFQHCDVRFYD